MFLSIIALFCHGYGECGGHGGVRSQARSPIIDPPVFLAQLLGAQQLDVRHQNTNKSDTV